LVVINHFEEKIYVRRISGKGESVYVESDSIRRGGCNGNSYLWKWVGIHREGVAIHAGDDVTGADSVV